MKVLIAAICTFWKCFISRPNHNDEKIVWFWIDKLLGAAVEVELNWKAIIFINIKDRENFPNGFAEFFKRNKNSHALISDFQRNEKV